MREERIATENPDALSPSFPAVTSGGSFYDLFVEFFCEGRPIMLKEKMEDLEKKIILNVLEKAQGNQRDAARILGIKYTTLNEKIKKYGIRFQKRLVIYPLSS
jgi:transcriptional regulator of acetoin/glycerol metabolism